MTSGNAKIRSGLPEFSKAKQLEWKRKMLLFSFFLVLAIIIWFLNALSKDYTTDIKYPITYSRFPQDKMLVSKVPDHLNLKVAAHGYAIISYKLSKRPVPINFPVTSFTMNSIAGDSTRTFLLTRFAREQVARQLPAELQLLEIKPDTLIFRFANQTQRMLPVEPLLNYEIEKDFTMISGVQIEPESLLVTGPDIYLDTMKSLKTNQLSLGLLGKSYSGKLKIAGYPSLNFDRKEINCVIQLEKLTEIEIEVPIQISELPDSLKMQTFPQRVKVKGKIGLSNYDRIVPEAFWIEVKYSEELMKSNRLQVSLRTKPEYLNDVSFYPQTVEFIISVK